MLVVSMYLILINLAVVGVLTDDKLITINNGNIQAYKDLQELRRYNQLGL
jgi:hypothetical protein